MRCNRIGVRTYLQYDTAAGCYKSETIVVAGCTVASLVSVYMYIPMSLRQGS